MRQKLLLLLLGVLSALPALAFDYTYEGVTLQYEVIDEEAKTCKVKGDKNLSGEIVIPEIANDGTTDYKVTSIDNQAFDMCKTLTSVVIGNCVETIGESAF